MNSINQVSLLGHVGSAPEVRYLPSGDSVMSLSIATTSRYLDKKSNEWKENTEWHKVVVFGKVVALLEKSIFKGTEVFVQGAIRTRKWKDAKGEDKQTTEIKADVCRAILKEIKPEMPLTNTVNQIDDDVPF